MHNRSREISRNLAFLRLEANLLLTMTSIRVDEALVARPAKERFAVWNAAVVGAAALLALM